MKHTRFRKLTLLGVSFLLVQAAFGQSEAKSEKHKTIRIDTRSISDEISNIFRTVAFEIQKIDFEKVGIARNGRR
ncbi:MAG: hypothetical protein ACYCZO_16740 [Daejeonella sp.]